jgi:hypothetical protein
LGHEQLEEVSAALTELLLSGVGESKSRFKGKQGK